MIPTVSSPENQTIGVGFHSKRLKKNATPQANGNQVEILKACQDENRIAEDNPALEEKCDMKSAHPAVETPQAPRTAIPRVVAISVRLSLSPVLRLLVPL